MKRVFGLILLFQTAICMVHTGKAAEPERLNAAIYMIDGRIWKGKTVLPYVNSELVEVYNKGRKQSFRSSDIEQICINGKENIQNPTIRMVYIPSYEYKSIKDETPVLNDHSKWMICLAELENISLYMVAQQYDQSRYYVRPLEQLSYGMPGNHWLYVKREGEVYPTRISLTPDSGYGSNQHFREVSQRYFMDCPELCDLIQEGIYTNQYIVDAIIYYNDCKRP